MARGSHGRQGPAPDPNALRRDRAADQAGWTTLPAAGREGEPPAWPLSDPSQRELDLWAAEWRRPQAVMWEINKQELEVAMYVRTLVGAESRQATAAERTLVLRQQENLGLTIPGLSRNKWRVGETGRMSASAGAVSSSGGPSVRDRLRVVGGST
jgi:hypothetical protein